MNKDLEKLVDLIEEAFATDSDGYYLSDNPRATVTSLIESYIKNLSTIKE